VATEPEQLEREIAQTRDQLGRDVDALAEKVSPKAATRRGVDRLKSAAGSVRDSVMGRTSDLGHNIADSTQSAKDSVTDAAESAKRTVRRSASGNPLAAGLVAFGVGWLLSSLIPVSRTEERVGQAVRKTARDQSETMRSAVSEMADNLREPAKESASRVGQTAADSAETVKNEAKQATSR
jgi:hypothetical protein